MISKLSKVKIADNSGAIIGRCIHIYNRRKKGKEGDLILLSILKTTSGSKIKKGEIFKSILIRTKVSGFNQNAGILVNTSGKILEYSPIGSRIKGPISSILKYKRGCIKIYGLTRSIV